MKKVLMVVFLTTLSGCAVFDAVTMAGFDANEYQLVTEVKTMAELAKQDCDDPSLMKITSTRLLFVTTEFKNYSTNIPNNGDSTRMSELLLKEVKGLSERYKNEEVSVYYCTSKMSIIERTAKTIQIVIGVKPR